MNVESELAALRATMVAKFERAEQDRQEQREEAQADRQAIKDTFNAYASRCDDARDALHLRCNEIASVVDEHQSVIDKVDGATWLSLKIGGIVAFSTGVVEWLMHKR